MQTRSIMKSLGLAVLLLAGTAWAVGARASARRDTRSTPAAKPAAKKSAKRKPALPKPQMAPTAQRIMEIQSALGIQGSYKGDPNGRWDAATVDAMKQFQSAHGLNPSGKLDALTLAKLGLGSSTAGQAAPPRGSQPTAKLTSPATNIQNAAQNEPQDK